MPNLNTARFSLNGTGTIRALKDRLEDRWVTVKDFGATGDGVTNDRAAIQATFDYAFGPEGSPHGAANAHLNKVVFFPRGLYKISGASLKLNQVHGGTLIGAGSHQSRIFWSGSAVEGSYTDLYSVIDCLYCWNTHMEGLTFDAGGVQNAVMVCGNVPSSPGTSDDGSDGYYRDIHITGAVVIGAELGGFGVVMGTGSAMSSERTWVKCRFTNCAIQGYRTVHGNSLNHAFHGCYFAGCRWGLFGLGQSGSLVVNNCYFENNSEMDVHCQAGASLIQDSYSKSKNFAVMDGLIVSNTHANAAVGEFLIHRADASRYYPPSDTDSYTTGTDGQSVALIGNHSTNGAVVVDGVSGGGVLKAGGYLMGNKFDNSGYLDITLGLGTPPGLVVDGTRLSP